MVETDVIVVGGGPVGLFLGCRLAQLGVRFVVLESRTGRLHHSRSIGVHPPSLEKFNELGLADDLVAAGVKVEGGAAYGNRRRLGELSFARCPAPYRFVLSLPQYETERLLETRLRHLAPDALIRGDKVLDVTQDREGAAVTAGPAAGPQRTYRAPLVVGCDGKESAVRRALALAFRGHAYPDTYLMGDFGDTDALEGEARIYLTDDGLVEAFPLPNGLRRWVAKTSRYVSEPSPALLGRLVRQRTGLELDLCSNTMLSAFGVQHFLAEGFARGRGFLAGDAAHVLSPIGGQGMNLGWLDAWALADALARVLDGENLREAAERYSRERKRAARRAARRAEVNMRLGRTSGLSDLKYAAIKGLLMTPAEHLLARLFTMRWL